jgi:hypothetical protein
MFELELEPEPEPEPDPDPDPACDGRCAVEDGGGCRANGGSALLHSCAAYGGGAASPSRNGLIPGRLSASVRAVLCAVRRRRHHSAVAMTSRSTATLPTTLPAIAPTSSELLDEMRAEEIVDEEVAVVELTVVELAVEVVVMRMVEEEEEEGEDTKAVLGQFVRFLPVSPAKSMSKLPR